MFMTGALCIIGAGSPLQPLVAILFELMYLLAVLKLAPYESDADDWSSFISSLTIMLTVLLGFAIIFDSAAETPTFSIDVLGKVMVGLMGTAMALQVLIMLWDSGWFDRCLTKKVEDEEVGKEAVKVSTRVVPIVHVKEEEDSMKREKSLRAVRLKFGANSKEYMEATKQLQELVVQDVNASSSSSDETPFASSSSSSSGLAADLEEKKNLQQRARASFVPPEL